MLALVSGPHEIRYASTGELVKYSDLWGWSEELGCVITRGPTAIQLDGTAYEIGTRLVGDPFYGGVGYCYDGGVALSYASPGFPWRRVALPSTAERDGPYVSRVGYEWGFGWGILGDRVIWVRDGGGHIRAKYFDDGRVEDDSTAGFASVKKTAYGGWGVFPYRVGDPNGGRWWVAQSEAYIEMYDATTKRRVPNVRTGVGQWNGLCYSVKHDIFVVKKADGLMYVYANEPEPARLSTPVLNGAARRGARVVVTCKLTGSLGEACPNRVVSFSASGGTIERTPVWTDQYGVAATVVRCADPGTMNVVATWEEG